jgi:hypothetical protein
MLQPRQPFPTDDAQNVGVAAIPSAAALDTQDKAEPFGGPNGILRCGAGDPGKGGDFVDRQHALPDCCTARAMTVRAATSPKVKLAAMQAGTAPDAA